jgi:hypothetical protein
VGDDGNGNDPQFLNILDDENEQFVADVHKGGNGELFFPAARFVNDDIIYPPQGISNISEWCKKDACWSRLQSNIEKLEKSLPDEFRMDVLEKARAEGISAGPEGCGLSSEGAGKSKRVSNIEINK